MRKILRFWCLMMAFALVVPGVVLGDVRADEDMGFVEFQTEASINFNEIVEVVLVNEETGHYYTQRLYRINNYNANISVPFGTYSLTAKVVGEDEAQMTQYAVVCEPERVVIEALNVAVPVGLRVDEFAMGDVNGAVWGDQGDDGSQDGSLPDDWLGTGEEPSGGEPGDGGSSGPLVDGDEGAVDGDGEVQDQDDGGAGGGGFRRKNVWGSLVGCLVMLGIGSAVMWYVFKVREDDWG